MLVVDKVVEREVVDSEVVEREVVEVAEGEVVENEVVGTVEAVDVVERDVVGCEVDGEVVLEVTKVLDLEVDEGVVLVVEDEAGCQPNQPIPDHWAELEGVNAIAEGVFSS